MISSILCPVLAAVAPLIVDSAAHRVTFTARTTDVSPGTILEFAFVGPNSDRAYEAMFVTDSDVTEIARAFDKAGIPRGRPVGQETCRFWPVGERVEISPPLSEFIMCQVTNGVRASVLYTGGKREANDAPFAETNMPSAVYSLYMLDQSLLLSADAADQSVAYGKFTSISKLRPGERMSFTVSWNGEKTYVSKRLELKPGCVREILSSLRGETLDCDVLPVFSPDLAVAEAKSAANALAVIDSRKICINGFAEGQFYYRGFLPDEKWRDRTKRLSQPLEIRVSTTNVVCTVIDEDWSVEGDDPALHPHVEAIGPVVKGFKGDTCLFFVTPNIRLDTLFSLMKRLPKCIRNWYVYID